jgi:hypothetical protein
MFCRRIALALLLPLAALAYVGCGGSNSPEPPPPPPPVQGSDASLAGIAVSAGRLLPAFDPTVGSYSLSVPIGHLGEDTLGVTVTLRDPRARLTINGLAVASGAQATVALREGANTISIAATSEDGRNTSRASIDAKRLALNTAVMVLNGIGGVPVENTVLRLTDSEGAVLADNVPLSRADNGQKKIFGLDPGQKYNIYARGAAAAASCFANFDPAKESLATLYCMRTSTTFYELEAPVIEDISFATTNANNAAWRTMSNGAYYVGPASDIAAVKVTMITRNISPVGFEDYEPDFTPISVNFDETASAAIIGAAGTAGTAVETNVPVTRGGAPCYRTTHRFLTPIATLAIFNKEHFLDVVCYDNIGNRTEQRVYVTLTNSASNQLADPDLRAVTPQLFWNQSQVYAVGGDLAATPGGGIEINAMDPVDPYGGYQLNNVRFYVRAAGATANLGIRGYEVWRSNGSANNFVKVATRYFASLTTATTGDYFQFTDRTPDLSEGKVFYRVRAFNGSPSNNGFSQVSDVFEGVVMPPSTAAKAASHQDVQKTLWPTFRIAPSNPKMFAKGADGKYANTDAFYFTLFVKNALNNYPFLMVPFRLYFTESELIGTDPGSEANKHRYGFERGMPTAQFLQVTGYTGASSTISAGTWSYAYDSKVVEEEGEDGEPIEKTVYTPFVYLDHDGSVVINTDSAKFQTAMQNAVRSAYSANVEPPYFRAGAPYIWNIFGNQGGIFWGSSATTTTAWTSANVLNAAYFTKGSNAAPNADAFMGVSVGSQLDYGLGSPEGWFTLIIDPETK